MKLRVKRLKRSMLLLNRYISAQVLGVTFFPSLTTFRRHLEQWMTRKFGRTFGLVSEFLQAHLSGPSVVLRLNIDLKYIYLQA